VIEGKIKRGLVAAAAGHTLKFTSSSVEFTLYIYIPQSTSRVSFKKTQEKKQQFCTWLFSLWKSSLMGVGSGNGSEFLTC
jgi:hypothetical protein